MLSLAGLSAAYPGYQAAEKTTADTQINQARARDAAIKLLGANVAGAALAGQQGPQAPPPGQASVPAPRPTMPAPMAPAAVTAPQGAPAPPVPNVPAPAASAPAPAATPAPPAAQSPPAAGGTGKLSLQGAVQQILRTSPGVTNHPEVLLAALTHFSDLGILDTEAESKVAETNKLPTLTRIGAVKQALAPPNPNVPPVKMLKPDTVTTFANGQKWTLDPTGQPKQVP